MKTAEIAKRLGVRLRNFQRYAKAPFYPQRLPDSEETRRIITEELAKLDAIPPTALIKALLAPALQRETA